MKKPLWPPVCLLTGCASTTYAHRAGDSRIAGAFEQSLRDVSVMRENPPDVLIHAVAAPYSLPGDGSCAALVHEVVALDAVQGPDVDAPNQPRAQTNTDIAALLSSAIGGVVVRALHGDYVNGAPRRSLSALGR